MTTRTRMLVAAETRSDRHAWLILVTIVAQLGGLALVAGLSATAWLLATLAIVAACGLAHNGWKQRTRFRGVDKVIVALAFGGLGLVIGQYWVARFVSASEAGGDAATAPAAMQRLLVMATVLALCVPACALMCSHEACRSRRRAIAELVLLHLLMMAGMFVASRLAAQELGLVPSPIWTYATAMFGMGIGAFVATVVFHRRVVEHARPHGRA
ncbi:MAG: hypothetical protein KDC98_11965 [Planctomycetes bacterium]|nr:hypothetical protein [Planctomycetota bacterium]